MTHFSFYIIFWATALGLSGCNEQAQDPQTSADTPQGKQSMASATAPKTLSFDVVMLSYYERPIFEVKLNGIDIGGAGYPPHLGTGGLMTGVPMQLGPQKITWRLDGVDQKNAPLKDNGNTVAAANIPVFKDPGPEYRYLGVHVYPDNTVEVIATRYWPENSEKGTVFLKEWEHAHGK